MRFRLPRSRRTWAVLFLLFAVCFVGGHYGLRWYAYQRGERELRAAIAELDEKEPGWRAADIVAARPKVPDEENGALVAERLLPTWGANFSVSATKEIRNIQGGKGSLADLDEAFKPYEKSLMALRGIHLLPKSRFDWPGGNLPDIFLLLDMGKLLGADAFRQAMKGDGETAGQSLAALANLGGYLDDEPTLMCRLAGSAQFVVLQKAWTDAVARVDIPVAHTERIAAALARHRQCSFKAAFRMERASHRILFEQLDLDSPNAVALGFGRPTSMFGRAREQYLNRARAPHRAAAEAEFIRRWTRVLAVMDLPAPERNDAVAAVVAYPLPGTFDVNPFEIMAKYLADDEHVSMQLLLFEAAVHAEIIRNRTGNWPSRIEDLAGRMPLKSAFGEPMTLEPSLLQREVDGRKRLFEQLTVRFAEAAPGRALKAKPVIVTTSRSMGPWK